MVIITGDLNARPDEELIQEYLQEYKDAYKEGCGEFSLFTAIFGPIDYMFYKGELELAGYLNFEFKIKFEDYPNKDFPSDHFPLISKFNI